MLERFKEFEAQARRIVLRPEEQRSMRQDFFLFIERHPIQVSHTKKLPEHNVRVYRLLGPIFSLQGLAFALMLVLVVGGGISYAAEYALPGDLLYPVKVGINERIRNVAAVSEEAEVDWKIVQTERRLEEAERLATLGRLDVRNFTELEARIERQTEEASETITRLSSEKQSIAANTSARFESSLRLHERILSQVAEETNGGGQVHAIIETVRSKALHIAEVRSNLEGRDSKDVATTTSKVLDTRSIERGAAETKTLTEISGTATSTLFENTLE